MIEIGGSHVQCVRDVRNAPQYSPWLPFIIRCCVRLPLSDSLAVLQISSCSGKNDAPVHQSVSFISTQGTLDSGRAHRKATKVVMGT